MKFVNKLIHGGPVQFCHRPLHWPKYPLEMANGGGLLHSLEVHSYHPIQVFRWQTLSPKTRLNHIWLPTKLEEIFTASSAYGFIPSHISILFPQGLSLDFNFRHLKHFGHKTYPGRAYRMFITKSQFQIRAQKKSYPRWACQNLTHRIRKEL